MRKIKRYSVFENGSCYYFFTMKRVLEELEKLGLDTEDVSWYITGGETIIVDCE